MLNLQVYNVVSYYTYFHWSIYHRQLSFMGGFFSMQMSIAKWCKKRKFTTQNTPFDKVIQWKERVLWHIETFPSLLLERFAYYTPKKQWRKIATIYNLKEKTQQFLLLLTVLMIFYIMDNIHSTVTNHMQGYISARI